MKHFLPLTLVLFFLSLSTNTIAQTVSYKEMMYDTKYNFYDVVKAANAYFDTNGRGKGSGWTGFERWRNENESKFYPTGDRSNVDFYLPANQYKEIVSEQNIKTKTSFENGWNELGPWDANNVTSHYSPGIGRVETFWVNPNNSNQMFIGSRSGGFWKTSNGGATWKNTTDFLVASGVFSLAVNPFDYNEILIAVQQGGNETSHGIYRSKDGGETWSKSNFEPANLKWGGLGDDSRIFRIRYHPTIQNRVYVGSSKGFFYSRDNLNTWTNAFTGSPTDIEFHPTKTNIVYVYNNNGADRNLVKISRDTGETFTNSQSILLNNNTKGHLAITPAKPANVYFASSEGVWKSVNEGTSFTFLSNPDESCLGFAVSDVDTLHLIYGYVDTEASSDGGLNFTQVTNWAIQDAAYIHADIRTLECQNGVFYVGTDGYFAKSSDWGQTWTILNDGTAIREFYAVGVSQGNVDVHMAGSQDNGTSILDETGWIEWNGGDGMEAIVHPLNQQLMIGSWQYGERSITTNGGKTRIYSGNPESGVNGADWEAPLLLDPENSMRVIHCGSNLYESLDFGATWQQFSTPGIGKIREADISSTNSKILCVAVGSSILLTEDGGGTWKSIRGTLPAYSITDIAFDPKNDSTILVTYNRFNKDNSKIYISYNRGLNWTNITYNLENMPLRTVVMDHSDSSYIYVGGEIGIYYKSLKGTQWTLYTTNMPNVTVKDLEIHFGSNTLKAATWGRGLFEYTLVGRNDFPSITKTSISQPLGPKVGVGQYITVEIKNSEKMQNILLFWSKNSTALDQTISFTSLGNNLWRSTTAIPSEAIDDRIYFKVFAENEQGEWAETYRFNYDIKPKVYCNAIGSNGTGSDYITTVSLNGNTNSTGQDFYGDFTSKTYDVEKGKNNTIQVGLQYHWDGKDSVSAWIDYNNNTDFEENERIVFSSLNSNHMATASFRVPNEVEANTTARLRVKSTYENAAPTPCGFEAGEVEDYTVVFRSGASIAKKDVQFYITPNPSSGKFSIALANEGKVDMVYLTDITGKEIAKQKGYGSEVSMDLNLSPGIYFITIQTDLGSGTQKLVID